jgi:response regulator RpfG family c-di-GMP phosphodiesterase
MTTILLVDDDENLLTSFERNFRQRFTVLTSNSGESGLQRIKENGNILLVISDMNMPGMDGVEFLSQVKKINPLIIRVMLTGRADINVAIQAVNEGNIFRFLTKPTTPAILEKIINDGLEQYRLVNGEKQLLSLTLNGSLEILNEVLGLTNPVAFGRSSRIKKIVQHILKLDEYENAWQYELAATLCLIGFISIPQPIQDKIYNKSTLNQNEKDMVTHAPKVAHDLLTKIPRFESIAEIILNQDKPFHLYKEAEGMGNKAPVALGSQILKLAMDVDGFISAGVAAEEIKHKLIKNVENIYNPRLTVTLMDYFTDYEHYNTVTLSVVDLVEGMVLDQNVFSTSGALLMVKGQEITETVLPRMINFQKYVGILEPIKILKPPEILEKGQDNLIS